LLLVRVVVVSMLSVCIGRALSVVIVQDLGWRYLFITVIPFALFSIMFAYKFLVTVGEVTKPKIDFPSILFSSVGFGTIIYGFSSAGESKESFLSPSVYLTIIIMVIRIILLSIRHEKL